MITRITLENFRGFDHHSFPIGPMTVIVGENNAGKTTIVEALRLISMVVLRYKNLGFHDPPAATNLPRRDIGVAPSLKNVEINFETIFYRYHDPPAIITAAFADRSSVKVYLFKDALVHAVITDPSGKVVRTKQQANRVDLPPVHIMPQVAPLQRTETILSPEYVKAAMASRLAPQHFRNQLNLRFDLFADFSRLVQETWPGVQVRELIGQGRLPGKELHLQVRNDDFVAEVADMGHGLQMWLQTMWFLTMSIGSHTVILDEPDVYMHADLQRRIIRFLRNRHPQIILATHSVEIMSEVDPEEILVVNKKRRESSFAISLPAVQAAIERFGSVHNIHLTRLLNARKVMLVEGKDLKLLKVLQDALFPDSNSPLQGLPHMSIGGWSGWELAIGSSMAFRNGLGERIRTYCILDSDYHPPHEIAQRYAKARQVGIDLHIWKLKEIENYLLSPDVISRVIRGRLAGNTPRPASSDVREQLCAMADSLEDEVLDALATEALFKDRGLGPTGANRAGRERLRQARANSGDLLGIVSGKTLLSQLSGWSAQNFGVSFGAISIAREMKAREMSAEIVAVLSAIEDGEPIPET